MCVRQYGYGHVLVAGRSRLKVVLVWDLESFRFSPESVQRKHSAAARCTCVVFRTSHDVKFMFSYV